MPKQTVGIFKWGLAKLSPDSYLHGALVLLPALVALVFFSCRLARRSVLAAVFVASLAYCHVLHGRDYPGTNLEIAVFVCFVFLCLWRELNRQFSEGLGKWVTGGASIAVITFALISDIAYFRSTVLSIMGSAVANTAAQSRLRADMSVLPKPMLWPVPSNSERTLTVYSAIMKGSSSVEMHGRSVESETMRAISPDLDFVGGPVLQRTRRNVGDYNTIIFATAEATDEPGIAAMQRIYNFDFRGFSCGQLADMPYQRIIACKRELVARTLPN
jgi:hypothetical protein